MKSKFFLLFFLFVGNIASANIMPFFSIIDSLTLTNKKWSVSIRECDYQNGFLKNAVIDSIKLSNHSDSVKVKQETVQNIVKLNNNYGSYKLSTDSLENAITLKQSGDILRVVIYGHYDSGKWEYKDSLLYGDEAGACVRAPKEGEFLSSQPYYKNQCGMTICNNITCYATLKGRIYDKSGEPLRNKTFDTFMFLYSGSFTTDNEGNYSYSIYTGFKDSVTYLEQAEYSYLADPSIKGYHSFAIEPISYNANPGDTIERDIHLKTAYVSAPELQKELSQFFCAPNPARGSIVFTYTIDPSVSSTNLFIQVYDIAGKHIENIALTSTEGSLRHGLDACYKAGSYSYVVRGGEQVIYRGQFFVQ